MAQSTAAADKALATVPAEIRNIFTQVKEGEIDAATAKQVFEVKISAGDLQFDRCKELITAAGDNGYLPWPTLMDMIPAEVRVVSRGGDRPPAWEVDTFKPSKGRNAGKAIETAKFTGGHEPFSMGRSKLRTVMYLVQNDEDLIKWINGK